MSSLNGAGGDLFEEMRCRLGCVHIFDIRFIRDKRWIRFEYDLIPKNRYSVEQYRDFERYAGM